MGENISEKKFTIKDDGTIVRGKKCPKCGRELISEGDYCEYCGAKIEGTTLTSTPQKGGSEGGLWLFIVAIIIVAAIVIITPFFASNNKYCYDDLSGPTAIEEAVEYDEDEEDYSEEAVSYDEDEEYYQEKAVSYDEEESTRWHNDYN